jgi:mRNA interferase YafQ
MLEIERTNQFKKDFKLARKRGKRLERIAAVVDTLANEQQLHPRHRPHKLSGELASCWECHVEPDYLLLYEYVGNRLVLVRLGTHSDLF